MNKKMNSYTESEIQELFKIQDFFEYNAYSALDNIKDHYFIDSGVTKAVYISKDETKTEVIKIPYQGEFDYVGGYFDEFHRAGEIYDLPLEYCDNYCYVETYLFNEAKKRGLDFLFAETKEITKVKGMPIYLQTKCVSYGDNNCFEYCTSLQSRTKTQELLTNKDISSKLELDWLSLVNELYGENIVLNLLKFLNDFSINDLHIMNYGFREEDNSPVIFDYAGFDD